MSEQVDTEDAPDAAGDAATTDDGGEPGVAASRVPALLRTVERRRGLGDAWAFLSLALLLLYLPQHDGGFVAYRLGLASIPFVLGAPLAVREFRLTPRAVRVTIGLWTLGLLLSLLFAWDRAEWTRATLAATTVPLVWLLAARLARRRWAGGAMLVLVMSGFGLVMSRAFLTWWGDILLGRDPLWRAVSWHNQSGMLMGGYALVFLGIALTARRPFAVAAGIAAGGAFAGMWFSGSRGAVIAVAVGTLVTLGLAVRATGWKRVAIAVPAVAMAVALSISGLILMGRYAPTEEASSLGFDARSQTPEKSARLRLFHWEAGLDMALAAPVSGVGPGGYRAMVGEYTDPGGTLTASAHNEYIEAFAEQGVFFGIAFALAFLGGTAVAVRTVWRRGRHEAIPEAPRGWPGWTDAVATTKVDIAALRGPLGVGTAGALVALALHLGVDFDMGYPLVVLSLVALWPIALPQTADLGTHPELPVGWGRAAVALVTVGALTVVTAAAFLASRYERSAFDPRRSYSAEELVTAVAPWDSLRAGGNALALAGAGQPDLARAALDRTLRWSPRDPRLLATDAIVEYTAGRISGVIFASRMLATNAFAQYPAALRALHASGDIEALLRFYDAAGDRMERLASLVVEEPFAQMTFTALSAVGESEGCAGAGRVLDGALADHGAILSAEYRTALADAVADICADQ